VIWLAAVVGRGIPQLNQLPAEAGDLGNSISDSHMIWLAAACAPAPNPNV